MSQQQNPWDRVDALETKVRELEARLKRLEEYPGARVTDLAPGKVIPGGTLHVPKKGAPN